MMASATREAAVQEPKAQLPRAMGFADLLLFYVVTGFTVRWIGPAAAAGPSAVITWLMACLAFYLPLMFTVLERPSRYSNEGGATSGVNALSTTSPAFSLDGPIGLATCRPFPASFALVCLLGQRRRG